MHILVPLCPVGGWTSLGMSLSVQYGDYHGSYHGAAVMCCLMQDTNKVLAISRIMVAWQPVGIACGVFDMCKRYVGGLPDELCLHHKTLLPPP